MNKTIVTIIIVIALSLTVFFLYRVIESKNEELSELRNKVSKMETLYSSVAYKGDSLYAIASSLSSYKTLTYAMIYRDSVRKSLKYKIGDIVYLKSDSSKAVIKDILAGGGKFDHYIKYQIVRKDNSTEMLSPELVY